MNWGVPTRSTGSVPAWTVDRSRPNRRPGDGHTSLLSSTEFEATDGEARLRRALERRVFFSGVGRTEL